MSAPLHGALSSLEADQGLVAVANRAVRRLNASNLSAAIAVHQIALVIYSKLEGAGQSSVYRALMFADDLLRHGDDVSIVFDGAGSTAAAAMLDPAHTLHPLFEKVRAHVRGVCRHCAKSYGVLDALQAAGLPMLAEDRGHASLRGLLEEGRQIITF